MYRIFTLVHLEGVLDREFSYVVLSLVVVGMFFCFLVTTILKACKRFGMLVESSADSTVCKSDCVRASSGAACRLRLFCSPRV